VPFYKPTNNHMPKLWTKSPRWIYGVLKDSGGNRGCPESKVWKGPKKSDAKNFYLIFSIFLPLHLSPEGDDEGVKSKFFQIA
jgi:hypothetical protein